jgi:hypothetical protein
MARYGARRTLIFQKFLSPNTLYHGYIKEDVSAGSLEKKNSSYLTITTFSWSHVQATNHVCGPFGSLAGLILGLLAAGAFRVTETPRVFFLYDKSTIQLTAIPLVRSLLGGSSPRGLRRRSIRSVSGDHRELDCAVRVTPPPRVQAWHRRRATLLLRFLMADSSS